MRDALGGLQSVLVLGGTSEIALALVDRLTAQRCRTVVLAARPSDRRDAACRRVEAAEATAFAVDFDADEPDTHADIIGAVFERHGDIDLVVLAFGVLGERFTIDHDPATAATIARTNYAGAVSSGIAAAQQLRTQGHGTLCVLSSVAGERVRAETTVYGSTKAGLDAFAQGLGDELAGSGAQVMIVRPGFVRTRMTEGLDDAPFATTAEAVADDIVDGLAKGRSTVWSPGILRWVFSVLRHLPRPIWRRVSG